MHPQAQAILEHLHIVSAERAARALDLDLSARVRAVKRWQHARFQRTYADLLASPRYGAAARFFLDDLYGPGDFSRRDAQFARIVPALVRLFPQEVVHTVRTLGELHSLSETLDTAMGRALPPGEIDARRYAAAWQAVGRPADRARQVRLMRAVGDALDGYTRSPLLRRALHLMRGPARLAGMSELQRFLERGFDTFQAMRGAQPFLDAVVEREDAFAAEQFAAQV